MPAKKIPTRPAEDVWRDTKESALAFFEENEDRVDWCYRQVMADIARQFDDPEGFSAFYELTHGNRIPEHAHSWINHIYDAKKNDKAALVFAWRGSWKTTTISVTFTAYRIGKEPQRANLVIQANDTKADQTTKQITDLIANSPAWRAVFPNVVPDVGRGWGANGYEVMDTSVGYEEWRAKNSARKDPTLVGYGIASKSLIGSHPDGVLLLDDIHDEDNTISAKERLAVVNKVRGTIMPFIVENAENEPGSRMITWFIAVGTPWTEDDAYHEMKATGEFDFFNLPAMERSMEGEDGAVYIGAKDMTQGDHADLYGWWRLTWPERFPVTTVITWRNRTGKREFARMFLLDLAASKETGMKYILFPHDKIDFNWLAYGGVDYASTIEIRGRRTDNSNRSRFSLAFLQETPMSKAVVSDGIAGHFSQAVSEEYVVKAQGMFPHWRTAVVEMPGKGEEFYSLLSRRPTLRLQAYYPARQSKKDRQERELGPWLEMGIIMVSDADTPFLNAFRKALDDWPFGSMDEIDSVLAATKAMTHILRMPEPDGEEDRRQPYRNAKKVKNPFAALGTGAATRGGNERWH